MYHYFKVPLAILQNCTHLISPNTEKNMTEMKPDYKKN